MIRSIPWNEWIKIECQYYGIKSYGEYKAHGNPTSISNDSPVTVQLSRASKFGQENPTVWLTCYNCDCHRYSLNLTIHDEQWRKSCIPVGSRLLLFMHCLRVELLLMSSAFTEIMCSVSYITGIFQSRY